jgi:DNA-binding response OmpR family regulator
MSTAARIKLKQVLIIEDDVSLREMIATSLRMRGFHVREAADGLSGLRLLEAYDPDVVVLDLGLPIATGFDVIKELRAVATTRLMPVIAISGFEDQLKQAKESPEFLAALSKPFDPEALIRAVERATVHGPVV